MSYSDLLKRPEWQEKRLKIMSRDKFSCRKCGNEQKRTLHVHHYWYERGKKPWEYPDEALITLCDQCHERLGRLRLRLDKVLSRRYVATEFVLGAAIGALTTCRVIPMDDPDAELETEVQEMARDSIIDGMRPEKCEAQAAARAERRRRK